MSIQLELLTMIKELVGDGYLYFDDPAVVRVNPHSWPLEIYGIATTHEGELQLMDKAFNWHPMPNTVEVVDTLIQRIRIVYSHCKKATSC